LAAAGEQARDPLGAERVFLGLPTVSLPGEDPEFVEGRPGAGAAPPVAAVELFGQEAPDDGGAGRVQPDLDGGPAGGQSLGRAGSPTPPPRGPPGWPAGAAGGGPAAAPRPRSARRGYRRRAATRTRPGRW